MSGGAGGGIYDYLIVGAGYAGSVLAERLATEAEPTETTALQFARLAKAVRQTLALEAELAGALEIKAAAQRRQRL